MGDAVHTDIIERKSKGDQTMTTTLSAFTYRKKGINAYLRKLDISPTGNIKKTDYFWPERGQESYQGKKSKVNFDLTKLENGYYEFLRCSGESRSSISFLHIQNAEIKQEWESINDLIQGFLPEFPQLTGTPKQISWAENIRLKAFRKGFDCSETEAKWWIDNRKEFI